MSAPRKRPPTARELGFDFDLDMAGERVAYLILEQGKATHVARYEDAMNLRAWLDGVAYERKRVAAIAKPKN